MPDPGNRWLHQVDHFADILEIFDKAYGIALFSAGRILLNS